MKGSKEILFGAAIAFAGFTTQYYVKQSVHSAERQTETPEPTQSSSVPEDPALSLNWGLQSIDAAKAWRQTRGSRKIKVAIIDTGCDVSHPDLPNYLYD